MNDQIQSRLLRWAALFLFLQSVILTLSPAVRERTWDVDYKISHWLGFLVWLFLMDRLHRVIGKHYPEQDPYIFPVAALLCGWGLLTIWRLDEVFGIRQMIWLGVSVSSVIVAIVFFKNLNFLRRYKYLFLLGGLLITGLTLLLGTNPLGYGPRLWLGCCGVYFQPSEPLKLLLIIYLAAYLSDRVSFPLFSFPLLIPTLVVTGLALLLLLVQRDLGTASIFVFLFTIMIFLATGKRRILIIAAAFLTLALLLGYFFIDIIHIRIMGWTNPWLDPSGSSYQIIQSLLAVANGEIFGRGLGIGSPLLVPVAISDFIYAAIVEETGLAGSIGLLALIWLITARGLIIAQKAKDRFRRYLSAGMSIYLGVQSLLIIGGNVRLLPLTGVTLPFVSYGGSSLLTSFAALFLLLIISNEEEGEPAPLIRPAPYSVLAGMLAFGFLAAAGSTAWWSVVRAPDLLLRTDNPRRTIADRYVLRGSLFDTNNEAINLTEGQSGSYQRIYLYPDLAPITGYTHSVFGQAGLEASLDPYLRGLQGNPFSLIFWNELIYGTPPAGLNVRLSIDLELQKKADEYLQGNSGAILLMNAETGEILVMASHPTYDPNLLDLEGESLSQDKTSPLLNRATQGLYPIGSATLPLIKAEFGARQPSVSEVLTFYKKLGFLQTPTINMPVVADDSYNSMQDLQISPLQMGTAIAALSYQGRAPSPRIATAVHTPESGWVVLPALSEPVEVIEASAANEAALSYLEEGKPFWMHIGQASVDETAVTWLLAGTLPDWKGTPLALVVVLEELNASQAERIGENLLNAAGLNQ